MHNQDVQMIKELEAKSVSATTGRIRLDDRRIGKLLKSFKKKVVSDMYSEEPELVSATLRRYENYKTYGKHTQDVEGFVGRHLGEDLINYLSKYQELQVWIIEGVAEDAWNFLSEKGFEQIEFLQRAKFTDYNKILAIKDSQLVFVLNPLSGRSTSIEALSNIAYPLMEKSDIAPIFRFFKSRKSTTERFIECLQNYNIDADIISFGYTENLEKEILSQGGELLNYQKTEEFYFTQFNYKNKLVLGLNLSPHFHGDRAGDFLTAFYRYSGKKVPVISIGTCGGITDDLILGDFVIATRSKVDDETLDHFFENKNQAQELKVIQELNLKTVDHISIDAVLYEDTPWAKKMNAHTRPLVVEKEGADLFIKAADLGFPTSIIYRVSDLLLKDGMDYNATEHKLKLTGRDLSEFQMALIEKVLNLSS